MRVAIVTVGDELLIGETVNTNAAWLGEQLHERGVAVERVTVIPDRVADIAETVGTYRDDFDAVIATGGLGPTHDDVTMDGVAAALDRSVVESEAALEWLTERGGYAAGDLAEGTSDIVAGARMLPNETGVAPGCVAENVYVLPGVPEEMRAMFERIADEFAGEQWVVESIAVDEPESALLDRIDALRERFDVTVGSYPGEHVRVRIQGTDEEAVGEAAAWLRERVTVPE